jgi:hypothetical protein
VNFLGTSIKTGTESLKIKVGSNEIVLPNNLDITGANDAAKLQSLVTKINAADTSNLITAYSSAGRLFIVPKNTKDSVVIEVNKLTDGSIQFFDGDLGNLSLTETSTSQTRAGSSIDLGKLTIVGTTPTLGEKHLTFVVGGQETNITGELSDAASLITKMNAVPRVSAYLDAQGHIHLVPHDKTEKIEVKTSGGLYNNTLRFDDGALGSFYLDNGKNKTVNNLVVSGYENLSEGVYESSENNVVKKQFTYITQESASEHYLGILEQAKDLNVKAREGFAVNLGKVDLSVGNTFKIKIGGQEVTVNSTANQTAAELKEKIENAIGNTANVDATVSITSDNTLMINPNNPYDNVFISFSDPSTFFLSDKKEGYVLDLGKPSGLDGKFSGESFVFKLGGSEYKVDGTFTDVNGLVTGIKNAKNTENSSLSSVATIFLDDNGHVKVQPHGRDEILELKTAGTKEATLSFRGGDKDFQVSETALSVSFPLALKESQLTQVISPQSLDSLSYNWAEVKEIKNSYRENSYGDINDAQKLTSFFADSQDHFLNGSSQEKEVMLEVANNGELVSEYKDLLTYNSDLTAQVLKTQDALNALKVSSKEWENDLTLYNEGGSLDTSEFKEISFIPEYGNPADFAISGQTQISGQTGSDLLKTHIFVANPQQDSLLEAGVTNAVKGADRYFYSNSFDKSSFGVDGHRATVQADLTVGFKLKNTFNERYVTAIFKDTAQVGLDIVLTKSQSWQEHKVSKVISSNTAANVSLNLDFFKEVNNALVVSTGDKIYNIPAFPNTDLNADNSTDRKDVINFINKYSAMTGLFAIEDGAGTNIKLLVTGKETTVSLKGGSTANWTESATSDNYKVFTQHFPSGFGVEEKQLNLALHYDQSKSYINPAIAVDDFHLMTVSLPNDDLGKITGQPSLFNPSFISLAGSDYEKKPLTLKPADSFITTSPTQTASFSNSDNKFIIGNDTQLTEISGTLGGNDIVFITNEKEQYLDYYNSSKSVSYQGTGNVLYRGNNKFNYLVSGSGTDYLYSTDGKTGSVQTAVKTVNIATSTETGSLSSFLVSDVLIGAGGSDTFYTHNPGKKDLEISQGLATNAGALVIAGEGTDKIYSGLGSDVIMLTGASGLQGYQVSGGTENAKKAHEVLGLLENSFFRLVNGDVNQVFSNDPANTNTKNVPKADSSLDIINYSLDSLNMNDFGNRDIIYFMGGNDKIDISLVLKDLGIQESQRVINTGTNDGVIHLEEAADHTQVLYGDTNTNVMRLSIKDGGNTYYVADIYGMKASDYKGGENNDADFLIVS